MVCFVLFDLSVKCFRFRQESKVRVDLLETKFLGGNQKFMKNIIFFTRRGSHGLNLMFHESNVIFGDKIQVSICGQ